MHQDKKKVNIFYSYSHKDEALRADFEAHMSGLKRKGLTNEWHDRKILAGENWDIAILSNIEKADIVLFLVSSDFLASDYCYDKEVLKSVEKHYNGHCVVVPIILRECDWEGTPFETIQGLPTDMKPVISRHWHNKDEAFTDVVKGLKKIVKIKFEEINKKVEGERALVTSKESLGSKKSSTPKRKRVGFNLRILTSGEEFDFLLFEDILLKTLMKDLKESSLLDRKNEYYFKLKRTDKELDLNLNLLQNNVKTEDTILVGIKTYADK